MTKEEGLFHSHYWRKLPGVGRLFSYSRLWLADDHVLLVQRRTFSESYRRFYFSDIESISICKTTARRISILALVIVEGLFGGLLLWSYFLENGGLLNNIACVGLGVTIVLLARTIVLGPTCKCQLQTAVQVVDLKPLRRLRAARKVQRTIVPLIQAAQGVVTEEQLDADNPEPVPVTASRFATPFRQEKAIEIRHESGRFHFWFFVLFSLGVPSAVFDIYYGNPIKEHVDSIFAGVCLILAVIALMKQSHSNLPVTVKYLIWAGVLLVAIASGITAALLFSFGMIDPAKALEHPMPNIHQLAPVAVLDVWCAFFAVASGTISVLGLLRLYKFRAETRASGPRHDEPSEQSEHSG